MPALNALKCDQECLRHCDLINMAVGSLEVISGPANRVDF